MMTSAVSWCFLGYFVILFAERAQSIVRIFISPSVHVFSGGFDAYVNLLTLLSLAATLVLLIGFNRDFWGSLFRTDIVPDYTMLVITAGVALLGGMVHTEFTIAPVQFGAYGVLILGLVLRTVQNVSAGSTAFQTWFSLVFLTVFSMAIPVMYRSSIANAALFHVIEAIVSAALVVCFTWMLRQMMVGAGQDLLMWIPMLIAAVGDAVIIAMRWQEEINWFVLIFAALSAVLFAVGRVLFLFLK